MIIEIGKKIRLLRLGKGLTQEQLAEKLNVTAQSVSKWENCLTAPDIQLLPHISVLFGVTIDELFSMTDEARLERIGNLLDNSSGETMIPEKDFENYKAFLTEKISDPKLKSTALTVLANLYNQQAQGYRTAAAKYAVKAIECEPEKKMNHSALRSAWNGANRDWYASNHYGLINYYTEFIKDHSQNLYAYQLLLDNLIADCRTDEAEYYLAKFKSFDKTCRSLWYEGQLLFIKGEHEKGEKCIEKMIGSFSDDWLAWSYMGDFYARLAQYDKADVGYERAIALQPSPKYIDNYLCLAEIRVIQKRYNEASEYYRKAVGLLETDWNTFEGDLTDNLKELAEKYSKMK